MNTFARRNLVLALVAAVVVLGLSCKKSLAGPHLKYPNQKLSIPLPPKSSPTLKYPHLNPKFPILPTPPMKVLPWVSGGLKQIPLPVLPTPPQPVLPPPPAPIFVGGTNVVVVNYGEPQPLVVDDCPTATDNPSPIVADPAPEADPAPVAPAAARITVVNRQATSISFLVDGVAYELAAGERQELDASQPRILEFDRGGKLGSARYSLSNGTYTFTTTKQGPAIFSQPATQPEP